MFGMNLEEQQKRKFSFVQHVWKINYAIGRNNSKLLRPARGTIIAFVGSPHQ